MKQTGSVYPGAQIYLLHPVRDRQITCSARRMFLHAYTILLANYLHTSADPAALFSINPVEGPYYATNKDEIAPGVFHRDLWVFEWILGVPTKQSAS